MRLNFVGIIFIRTEYPHMAIATFLCSSYTNFNGHSKPIKQRLVSWQTSDQNEMHNKVLSIKDGHYASEQVCTWKFMRLPVIHVLMLQHRRY